MRRCRTRPGAGRGTSSLLPAGHRPDAAGGRVDHRHANLQTGRAAREARAEVDRLGQRPQRCSSTTSSAPGAAATYDDYQESWRTPGTGPLRRPRGGEDHRVRRRRRLRRRRQAQRGARRARAARALLDVDVPRRRREPPEDRRRARLHRARQGAGTHPAGDRRTPTTRRRRTRRRPTGCRSAATWR